MVFANVAVLALNTGSALWLAIQQKSMKQEAAFHDILRSRERWQYLDVR
jgi:hypothetical protein